MPETKRSVFISYALSDRNWAQELARSLKDLGQDAWIDGDEESLEKGLRESNLIVLLATPENVNRPNFFFDIGAAVGLGKPLVFVRSADLDLGAVPAALRHYKFLVKGSPEATAEQLVQEIAA
jgi:hypothetical protein